MLDYEEICLRERIRSTEQSDAAVAAVISVALAPYLLELSVIAPNQSPLGGAD
jgi:hypothetical protein